MISKQFESVPGTESLEGNSSTGSKLKAISLLRGEKSGAERMSEKSGDEKIAEVTPSLPSDWSEEEGRLPGSDNAKSRRQAFRQLKQQVRQQGFDLLAGVPALYDLSRVERKELTNSFRAGIRCFCDSEAAAAKVVPPGRAEAAEKSESELSLEVARRVQATVEIEGLSGTSFDRRTEAVAVLTALAQETPPRRKRGSAAFEPPVEESVNNARLSSSGASSSSNGTWVDVSEWWDGSRGGEHKVDQPKTSPGGSQVRRLPCRSRVFPEFDPRTYEPEDQTTKPP